VEESWSRRTESAGMCGALCWGDSLYRRALGERAADSIQVEPQSAARRKTGDATSQGLGAQPVNRQAQCLRHLEESEQGCLCGGHALYVTQIRVSAGVSARAKKWRGASF